MRSRSLSDRELTALLEPAADGAQMRGQVAVGLIAEAGVPPRELAGYTTNAALRLVLGGDPALSPSLTGRLEALLERAGERRHLLGATPLGRDGLRKLCVRFGERRGVAGATPERLRRTWLRRTAAAEGIAEAARRAGVSEDTVRRQLAAERAPSPHRPPAVGRPGARVVAGAGSVRVELAGLRALAGARERLP